MFPSGLSGWGCVRLAPAPPRSWLPLAALLSWWPPGRHPPASGCEISQCRSPCQLVSHVGDVSIFTGESSRFQVPQLQPERSSPRGAAATSGALGGAAALPATALIAVTQGAGSSLGRHGVTGTALVGRSHEEGCLGKARPLKLRWCPHLLAVPHPEPQWRSSDTSFACGTPSSSWASGIQAKWGLVQAGWDPGTGPVSHVALGGIATLAACLRATVRSDRDGSSVGIT